MERRLVIDGTAVYELDEKCLQDKKCKEEKDTLQDKVRISTEREQVVDCK